MCMLTCAWCGSVIGRDEVYAEVVEFMQVRDDGSDACGATRVISHWCACCVENDEGLASVGEEPTTDGCWLVRTRNSSPCDCDIDF